MAPEVAGSSPVGHPSPWSWSFVPGRGAALGAAAVLGSGPRLLRTTSRENVGRLTGWTGQPGRAVRLSQHPATVVDVAPLAQRQSNGLLIRRFRVQVPGGARFPRSDGRPARRYGCTVRSGPSPLTPRGRGPRPLHGRPPPVDAGNHSAQLRRPSGTHWMSPPRRSDLRSLARPTSPMSAGVVSRADGARWPRERRGQWEL